MHDATTMSTRCQHDVHFKIVYCVTLSFFYQYVSLHNATTMLKIIFLHDATMMSTKCQHDIHFKIVYLVTLSFFYQYVSLYNATTMLPQCSQDAYTMYKEHYSTSMHIWIVLVGVKHYQQPTRLA